MSYDITLNDLKGLLSDDTLQDISDWVLLEPRYFDKDCAVFSHRDLSDMIADDDALLFKVLNVCQLNDSQCKELDLLVYECMLNSINIFELNFGCTTFNVRAYLESALKGNIADKNAIHLRSIQLLPDIGICESFYFIKALACITKSGHQRVDLGEVFDLLKQANMMWYRKNTGITGSLDTVMDMVGNLVDKQVVAYHKQRLMRMIAIWSYNNDSEVSERMPLSAIS